ncbi:hypothetical protein [Leptothrix cholodnii]|uniref:hypothetical protein n=1 Tax=Leptothrix cholodnii TaxID=34029 RepID=UPI0003049DE9|nr:hypothetical protein [Leptothrix cholodnii]
MDCLVALADAVFKGCSLGRRCRCFLCCLQLFHLALERCILVGPFVGLDHLRLALFHQTQDCKRLFAQLAQGVPRSCVVKNQQHRHAQGQRVRLRFPLAGRAQRSQQF